MFHISQHATQVTTPFCKERFEKGIFAKIYYLFALIRLLVYIFLFCQIAYPCLTVQVLKKRNIVDWAEHMQQSLHFELKAIKNPNIKKTIENLDNHKNQLEIEKKEIEEKYQNLMSEHKILSQQLEEINNKKVEIPKHSLIHFFEMFLGCINNSETVDENGFSKSQLDNLYSYYSQFEDTPDPIECIIETYKRNQNQTKTRLNVIQV